MSVKFDALGDKLTRTSGLPSNMQAAFTVIGWVQIVTDRNDWTTFCCLSGSGDFAYIQSGSSGTDWKIWTNAGSQDIYNASAGTWVYLIMQIFQSGSWYSKGGYILAGGTAVNWSSSLGLNSDTPNLFALADTFYTDETLFGLLSGVKVWTAALSDAEILREMYTFRPHRLSNLWAWYPFVPLGAASGYGTDYSGNGKTLTVGGTLAWDSNPPRVSWGSYPLIYPKVAGGTLRYQDVSGAITPSGALSRQAGKSLAGGLTPSGTLSRLIKKAFTGGITPAGLLAKRTFVYKIGSLTLSGSISRQTGKSLAGGLTLAGLLSRQTNKILVGQITPSGIGIGVRIPTLTAAQIGAIIRLTWTE